MFRGRLNPRCTIFCETCGKYYGSKMADEPKDGQPTFALQFDENGREECIHYNNIEIPKAIHDEHMEELKAHGFYEGEDEDDLLEELA